MQGGKWGQRPILRMLVFDRILNLNRLRQFIFLNLSFILG